eukprot:TRINITY_DN30295_c0_g1_i1.p1 TRINITY_DN30295_c0_g1~~TRINITY_DN30295_c0_g1_i1.p1  ORF type:complete len:292 (-),score=27.85 TRINITY_DN30295_c0_g1_i1:32-907(-)
MLPGILVLFCVVVSSTPILITVNEEYEGFIGNDVTYRFVPSEDFYQLSLTVIPIASNSTEALPVQFIVQDESFSLITNIDAPAMYNNYFVSNTAWGYICGTGVKFLLFIPAGENSSRYKFELTVLSRKLSAGQTNNVSLSFDLGSQFVEWFYFDNTEMTIPMQINVESISDDIAVLGAWMTRCPSIFQYLDHINHTIAQLSFSTRGRLTISTTQGPYLQPGRWFFGLQASKFNPGVRKNISIVVNFGLDPKDYQKSLNQFFLPNPTNSIHQPNLPTSFINQIVNFNPQPTR